MSGGGWNCRRCGGRRTRPVTTANLLMGKLLELAGQTATPAAAVAAKLEPAERLEQLEAAVRRAVRLIHADDDRLCLSCHDKLSVPLPVDADESTRRSQP